jgi:glycosyltransferase involved in cell wall biosynthesis
MKAVFANDIVYRYACRHPGAVGGSERYQWLLARALAVRGWAVTVAVREGLDDGQVIRIDGVKFAGIGHGQFLVAWYKLLASERPDWYFSFGSTHLLGPTVAISKLFGTRSVFAAQFDLDVFPRRALSERRRFWPLYALGLAWSDRIFVQHRKQHAELPAQWQAKSYVVPGAVELPESYVSHSHRQPRVAWVGVLRQPKRPDVLIEIARRLPSVQFVVCGGTSVHRSPEGYGEQIVAQLNGLSNVCYLGHVAPSRAIEVISGAALLLSTSDAEGFPSVFVEAWAQGTPIVTLHVDPDSVIARNGLGVVGGGIDAAVRSIQALVASPEEREILASRCRKYAATTHVGEAVGAIVESAITSSSAPSLQPFEVVRR